MKKQFFILCFVFLATVSYTQNYQLIQPANEQHFLFVNTINTNANYEQEIYSIRIDSVATQGTETHYYNYKILEEDYLAPSCPALHSDSSWLGHQIIAANNGDYVFFNQELDSIIIQSLAPLNSTWTLYTFDNGDYIEATLTSIDTATLLGNLDSIKTIDLQVKDVANNPVTHPMNSKTLQFSKQNGWVQFFNFHTFPNNTTPYNLVGSSAQPNVGITNPTQADIFNFNVGDEIHSAGEYSMHFAPWQFGKHKQIKIILSKTISANQDTISYTYERCLAKIVNDAMANINDTTYTTDTVSQQIIISETSNLDQLTHELASDSMGYSITSIRDFASTRRQKETRGSFYYDNSNNCWTILFGVWPRVWIEGLGGPYRNEIYSTDMPVYYKKGTETWGTPIDCATFLSINTISTANNSVKVFPNPFTETANIQIEDFQNSDNWSIQLLDLTGKVVRAASIQNTPFTLQKENLSAGVYFYQINNSQQQKQYTGKLIVQ